jgi:predicted flap endonuclease-1-like 5' DNA nuclease
MAKEIPKIEQRNFDDFLSDFKALVPFYTPEWHLEEKGKGADLALVKIFIQFLRTIYHRLNRLPEKHFISFLDEIGIKRIPAQSALVPVTFLLSEGAAEPVLIPAKTQVAAGDVIFETEKNLLASPAQLVNIFHIDGKKDAIFQGPANIISGEPVLPVETGLLYPAGNGDRDIFVQSGEDILEGDIIRIGESEDVIEYGIVSTVSENRVTLVHPLEIRDPGCMNLPTIAIHGVGETFSQRLETEGIYTVKQLLQYSGKVEELSEILGKGGTRSSEYYREQAKNILENAEKCVLDEPYEVMLQQAATFCHQSGTAVKKVTTLEVFKGKNLQEHILYLGHEELFNIDADALIVFRVTFPQWGGVLCDPGAVQWEYWGEAVERRAVGEEENPGWHPLEIRPGAPSGGEFYLRKIFTGEISEYTLNDTTSRWLRCKIKDINKTKDIEIKDINVSVVDVRFLELPTAAIRGIGDTFAQRLAEKGVHTVEQLLEYRDKALEVAEMIASDEQSLEYYREMAENFLQNAEKLLLDEKYEKMLIGGKSAPVLLPDMVFYHDLVYDLTAADDLYLKSAIHPFGKKPVLDSTFYIACKEFFSKPDIDILINFEFSFHGVPGEGGVELYWEYWDGEMWNIIKALVDNTENFFKDGEVTFTNPGDITSTNVNGKENFYVRVRLVSGDYGREEFVESTQTVEVEDADGNIVEKKIKVYKLDDSKIKPPVITKLVLSSTYEFIPEFYTLKHCLTSNNLELIDRVKESWDPEKIFKPFIPLETESRKVYLAFDKKLEKGPIAMFFSIAEKPVSPEQVPFIHWEYYNENRQWQRLDVLDATMSLTRTGVIEFVFPLDFRETRIFGTTAYWVRAVYINEENEIAIPTITGVFLNTTWALQSETISAEILGSGDGTANQVFSFTKAPVTTGSEEIWVDELKTISAEEQKRILEENQYQVKQEIDEKENITEFWIKWKPTENILNASPDDRCYEIDNVSGNIMFGDGINGKILPTGADNIKADYCSGGGKQGNLPVFEITDLKTSIPFLDSAYNPLTAGGGTDTEAIALVMERGPNLLKHRNRAITVEDFEQLAFQAAGGIARVKCLSNMSDQRKSQEGRVTVIVIPQTEEEKPRLSLQMKHEVEQYLEQRTSFRMVERDYFRVIGPVYVDVSVHAQLAATSIEMIPLVEKACFARLKDFLNPLCGGSEKRGWDFGKIPCFSDFYALLERIEHVDHVKDLLISIKIPDTEVMNTGLESEYILTPENPEDFPMPPYAVISSGEHKVEVSV